MENTSDRKAKHSVRMLLRHVPMHISRTSEHIFYELGLRIAQRPGRWLAGSTIVVLFCLAGLLCFRQEKNPLKLWVPPDSDFVRDTEWITENFGQGMRVQTLIMTGKNVLEPRALMKLNEVTSRILKSHATTGGNTSWTDVCFKIPVIPEIARTKRQINSSDNGQDNFFDFEGNDSEDEDSFDLLSWVPTSWYCSAYNSFEKSCYLKSILDIWKFDDATMSNLTTDEIVRSIKTVRTSPSLGHKMNYGELLGGIIRDDSGRIIGAKAVKTQWFLNVNFSAVDMNKIGNDVGTADWATEDVLEWEKAFLEAAKDETDNLRLEEQTMKGGLTLWYEAGRSFGDISSSAMFQDITKVIAGVILMSFYVQVMLSRFNWVEWRFCLTTAGLMCVGGAFIIAVGICSLAGVPYGPVHTSLPFMLMGLGVDDIFVMVAAWDQLHSNEKNHGRPLTERIALMLSHAGSSIFITSLTDVVAFVIGASTILPSLQSFCIYAAVGVFVTFLLQITFFVGFFTLDTKRIEAKRNGILPCIVHSGYQPRPKNEDRISWRVTGFLYSRGVLTSWGKPAVLMITAGIAAFGIYGSTRLEQRFDPEWFLPEGTYLAQYLNEVKQNYPEQGHEGFVFMGKLDYVSNFQKILQLCETLRSLDILQNIDQWPVKFARFAQNQYDKDLSTVDESMFSEYLSQFLFSKSGGKYQSNFRFAGNLTCGERAPKILISSMEFTFAKFQHPTEWLGAMDGIKETCSRSGIDGFVTVWSKVFATWVTDKAISQEVMRNLILALICVMGMTAVLVAEFQTCFWIFLCVLLTLVDVCGLMYYWGLTVDIVSCIGLELAVGLSVDYATHVAHAFLNSEVPDVDGSRMARTLSAVRHIGAAVVFGAGSTLLALSLLATSEAYVFRSFFKIFFLVVTIGLWHGLIFLPVVFSVIGPRALRSDSRDDTSKRTVAKRREPARNNIEMKIDDVRGEAEIELMSPLENNKE
ncbi:NPC intracellular cholesterol transporter 1-like [Diprion similis]|uniref:NPC intracellular cholesterol transporter 1-like n=1 Tax=Diprion similis TaxID=362088 RepID=UPI001EF927DB|nr:NPC intracellular cholesterol transporter 1-like [Diprion similis]